MATINTSIRIDEDLWNRIGDLGEMIGQTRSEILSRIVRNGIEDEERVHRMMRDPVYGRFLELLIKPSVMSKLAQLAGESLTSDDLERARRYCERLEAERVSKRAKKARA